MSKKILIVGAGISGIACANALKNEHEVWLLEKDGDLGGLSAGFSCKATDKCNYCGWCLVNENLKELKENKRNVVNVLTGYRIINADKKSNGFEVEIQKQDTPEHVKLICFDYIVLASGAQPFNAGKKPRFGYARFPNVITGYDLEKKLRTSDLSGIKELAFIQCVGSRDESINALYCSKVCCRYAIRMANYLLYKYPELKVTIFYMDMQVQGEDIKTVYEKIKDKIEFVKGIPSFFEKVNNKIKARFEDQFREKIEKKEFDMAVLSVGLAPAPENEFFSKIFGVNLDENGFIETADGIRTNIENILAVGTAASPHSIKNSIALARSVSESIK